MPILTRKATRIRLHARLRRKVTGTGARPRFSVSFSGKHIYAQLIDDETGKTLVSVMTTEKGFDAKKEPKKDAIRPNVKGAEEVGKLVAERAKEKSIAKVVFDRGGFRYHGKIKALADAARAAGLEF